MQYIQRVLNVEADAVFPIKSIFVGGLEAHIYKIYKNSD